MKFKSMLLNVFCSGILLIPTYGIARAPQGLSHIHGATFNKDGSGVLLGTHEGIFSLNRNGDTERISSDRNDYMSFISHPSIPGHYLGSGHPKSGGNMGYIASEDGGKSWSKISDGINGPVDFHKLALSPSGRTSIIGDHGGLQVSIDGGNSWKKGGTLPANAYSFSMSTLNDSRLYAATDQGVRLSDDQGKSWKPASSNRLPATAVAVLPEGQVMAYIVGSGLVITNETNIEWVTLFDGFGKHVPINITWEAGNQKHLLIRDQANALWESMDGGNSWQYFIDEQPLSFTQTQGKALFNQHCVACHQSEGVGESYSQKMLTDQSYISAPSMDYLEHAWHHTDDQLAETIKNGSPRTTKMPPWSEKLSDQQIGSIISYIKSLWTQRELDCQGPKHMSCM